MPKCPSAMPDRRHHSNSLRHLEVAAEGIGEAHLVRVAALGFEE
jgi:hypothetical protein